MDISKTLKYGAVVGVLVVTGLFLFRQWQNRKHDLPATLTAAQAKTSQVIIDTQRKEVTVRPLNGLPGKVNVGNGIRRVVITQDEKGRLHIEAPQSGWIVEPGLSLFYSDKLRLGADVQLYYWHAFGVTIGLGSDTHQSYDAYGAVTYNLPFALTSNTSIFAGYSIRRYATFGVRVKL